MHDDYAVALAGGSRTSRKMSSSQRTERQCSEPPGTRSAEAYVTRDPHGASLIRVAAVMCQ
jgi:hypothetical protein